MVRLDIRSGIRGYSDVIDRLYPVLGKSQISSHWVTWRLLANIAMKVTVCEYLWGRCEGKGSYPQTWKQMIICRFTQGRKLTSGMEFAGKRFNHRQQLISDGVVSTGLATRQMDTIHGVESVCSKSTHGGFAASARGIGIHHLCLNTLGKVPNRQSENHTHGVSPSGGIHLKTGDCRVGMEPLVVIGGADGDRDQFRDHFIIGFNLG